MSWIDHALPAADRAECEARGERMEWRRQVNHDVPKGNGVPAREFNFAELAYSGYFHCKGCGAIGLVELCGRCGRLAKWEAPVPAPDGRRR